MLRRPGGTAQQPRGDRAPAGRVGDLGAAPAAVRRVVRAREPVPGACGCCPRVEDRPATRASSATRSRGQRHARRPPHRFRTDRRARAWRVRRSRSSSAAVGPRRGPPGHRPLGPGSPSASPRTRRLRSRRPSRGCRAACATRCRPGLPHLVVRAELGQTEAVRGAGAGQCPEGREPVGGGPRESSEGVQVRAPGMDRRPVHRDRTLGDGSTREAASWMRRRGRAPRRRWPAARPDRWCRGPTPPRAQSGWAASRMRSADAPAISSRSVW